MGNDGDMGRFFILRIDDKTGGIVEVGFLQHFVPGV